MPYKDPEQHKANGAKWREANRQYLRDTAVEYRKDPEVRARIAVYLAAWRSQYPKRMMSLANAARVRAATKGIEYDEGLLDHLQQGAFTSCACCGKELDFTSGSGIGLGRGKGQKPLSPSLDRRDNAKGYTIGNVFVVCFRCNTLKKDSSVDEIRTVIAYLKSRQEQ